MENPKFGRKPGGFKGGNSEIVFQLEMCSKHDHRGEWAKPKITVRLWVTIWHFFDNVILEQLLTLYGER